MTLQSLRRSRLRLVAVAGAVLALLFHFYSGAQVTYEITRTGTTVTGSAS